MDTTTTTALLPALRGLAGLSLRQLAQRADMNPGRLSVIERGLTPTGEEAARIARAVMYRERRADVILDPTTCVHCHEMVPGVSSRVIVGVGARPLCRECEQSLDAMGFDILAERRNR